VVARSKAWVCGHSLAGMAGSNPTGDMDVCLLCLLYVVGYRSLRRADHSSRGVLATVWYVVVCDLEASRMSWPCPASGHSAREKKKKQDMSTEFI
jgi:hypothetical protein